MFLIKNIIARFDKIATWRKNSIDDPRAESITADPEEPLRTQRRPFH